MKDIFSTKPKEYTRYRPGYPKVFFDYLFGMVPANFQAWDCGTGSGQVAFQLAKSFDQVFATDISQSQIDNAQQARNISYSVQPAEETNFEDNQFDLIVVAQAIHWFDFEKFYGEVRRTAKKEALICIVGYGRIVVSDQIDTLITAFYFKVLGDFWDKERTYIDEAYETIPFPFDEIKTPSFDYKQEWDFEHLIGYLNTWSAVKHFINEKGYDPVEELKKEIMPYWPLEETKTVNFPVLLRIGKV